MRVSMMAIAIGSSALVVAASPAGAVVSPTSTSQPVAVPIPSTTAASTSTSLPARATTTRRPAASVRHRVRHAIRVPRAAPVRASAAAGRAANTVVTISSNCAAFCFVPAQTTIAAGDTITWHDTSGTEHIIARCQPANCNGTSGGTGTDAKFTSANLTIAAGGTGRFTFAQPGTYVYYCTLHGYAAMHGTITVTAVAPTTTAVIATLPTTPTPPPTTSALPQLAHTGASTNGSLAIAGIFVVVGLAATSFRLRRRHS